jgi:hypothetical protein
MWLKLKENLSFFSEMTGGIIIIIIRFSHPTNVSYVTSQNTVITEYSRK